MDASITEKCPNCGDMMVAEGINVGIGYVYPPFHCNNCGYSECCERKEDSGVCERCDQYGYCYKKE